MGVGGGEGKVQTQLSNLTNVIKFFYMHLASMKMYKTRPEAQRLTPKRPLIWYSNTLSATVSARASANDKVILKGWPQQRWPKGVNQKATTTIVD